MEIPITWKIPFPRHYLPIHLNGNFHLNGNSNFRPGNGNSNLNGNFHFQAKPMKWNVPFKWICQCQLNHQEVAKEMDFHWFYKVLALAGGGWAAKRNGFSLVL